jgi:hypothetical protein
MKKLTSLTIISLCFIISVRSQDFGYKTIDVGGEFQWYPKGYIYMVHLAYNFPIHHSVQARIGYNKSNWKEKGYTIMKKVAARDFRLVIVIIF